MKTYKILSFTGGSTKGVGLSAIGIGVMEHYEPNLIIGESVSAIFAIPLVMKEYSLIKDVMFKFSEKDIFGKYKPLNKTHTFPSIRGLFRLIIGKNSLGTQDMLVNYIKNYLTKELFEEWKLNSKVDVLVATTNYNSGLLEYFNLKDYNYKQSLNIILASCNIPILINPIKINNQTHFDGGVIKANPGIDFLRLNSDKISHYYSVWNRVNDINFKEKIFKEDFNQNKIVNILGRSVSLMIQNQSLDNEYLEDLICSKYNITHKKYFLDSKWKVYMILTLKINYMIGIME